MTALSVLVAIGSICSFALWIIRRYFKAKNDPLSIIKLEEKVDAVTQAMSAVMATKPFDRERYNELKYNKRLLNKRIDRLKRSRSK